MILGVQQKHIPWWRILWWRLTGRWEGFINHVREVDALDAECPLCHAHGAEACDAGLHS